MAKIVVIGGGVAGLRAANLLATMHHDVIILEARERLGGRIHTIESITGTPIELGASFWEGTRDSEIYSCLKAQIKRLDLFQSSIISLETGVQDVNSILPLMIEAEQSIETPAYRALSFSEMIAAILAQQPRNQSEQYWLTKCVTHVLQHFNTSLDKRSFGSFALSGEDSKSQAWNPIEASCSFVQNGYHKLTEQLAAECLAAKVSIVLNQVVLKITTTQRGVVLNTTNREWLADYVISTIPIGVLKKQAAQLFSPPLASEKQAAIAAMGVHQGVRIALEFEGVPFWGEGMGPYLYIDSANRQGLKEFRNYYPLYGKALLLTDSYTQIEEAFADLATAYGLKTLPALKQHYIYHWGDDVYASGAYPYRTPAMNEETQRALEKPHGNIYFAGADFSRFGFSVHNAYAMGEKAAREVGRVLLKGLA